MDRCPSGRHWGRDDERAFVDLLGRFDEPPDDLFVIAPFRARSTALGTVHTFQGREADTVILLLSAAAERPRARTWAASPPNLLDVAVTRAREHLIVIGNRVAWSSESFASEISRRIHLAGPSGAAPPWPPPRPE